MAQTRNKMYLILTFSILSSSMAEMSVGIDDTPVSLLAKILSEPATEDSVARLPEETKITNISIIRSLVKFLLYLFAMMMSYL